MEVEAATRAAVEAENLESLYSIGTSIAALEEENHRMSKENERIREEHERLCGAMVEAATSVTSAATETAYARVAAVVDAYDADDGGIRLSADDPLLAPPMTADPLMDSLQLQTADLSLS